MNANGERAFLNQCRSGFLERIAKYVHQAHAREASANTCTPSLHDKIHQPNLYSDMTIRLSGGTELFCHRNIVCGQCAFFENALKPGRFKESFTGIVELQAYPPQAIEALIEFLYKMDYSTPPELDHADQALFHLDVYNAAIFFQVLELRKWADQILYRLIKTQWTEIIPVIPELSRELRRRDAEDAYGYPSSLKVLSFYCVKRSSTLLDDDIWTGLHREVPNFMEFIADFFEGLWEAKRHVLLAGQWLDRLGGEHAVGLIAGKAKCPGCGVVQTQVFGTVRDELFRCKAGEQCNFRAAGNVWLTAVQTRITDIRKLVTETIAAVEAAQEAA